MVEECPKICIVFIYWKRHPQSSKVWRWRWNLIQFMEFHQNFADWNRRGGSWVSVFGLKRNKVKLYTNLKTLYFIDTLRWMRCPPQPMKEEALGGGALCQSGESSHARYQTWASNTLIIISAVWRLALNLESTKPRLSKKLTSSAHWCWRTKLQPSAATLSKLA